MQELENHENIIRWFETPETFASSSQPPKVCQMVEQLSGEFYSLTGQTAVARSGDLFFSSICLKSISSCVALVGKGESKDRHLRLSIRHVSSRSFLHHCARPSNIPTPKQWQLPCPHHRWLPVRLFFHQFLLQPHLPKLSLGAMSRTRKGEMKTHAFCGRPNYSLMILSTSRLLAPKQVPWDTHTHTD